MKEYLTPIEYGSCRNLMEMPHMGI